MVFADGFWLFVFALVFFGGVLVRNMVKFTSVNTKLLKTYYLWAVIINVILVISLACGLLGYFVPFALLFLLVVLISLFRFGKSMRAQTEETEGIALAAKDEKLMFFDLFTRKGWVKIALRFGTKKAIIIIFFIELIMLLILFSLMKFFFYTEFPVSTLINDSIIFSLIGSLIFYQTIKKLKRI
ncbi:hypothetical protein HYT55_01635 [Candidatus Woesearchaeota archaeon]|nr:hypothetical protein [Candidatus Woesearchaeota archaeon]